MVTANNVRGGKEDGDKLSKGKYSVDSQLVVLKRAIIFNISY